MRYRSHVVEMSMIVGAVVGVIYSLGEHGFIPAWGGKADGNHIGSGIRLMFCLMFMGMIASDAETTAGFLLVGFAGIGAAKMAELATSFVTELFRGY